MSRPNVLLFGLGGIGGIYACILHLSGECDVSVVARSNYAAVKTKGFRLISNKFGNHDDIKFAGVYKSCEDAAASGRKFDFVLCANKALLDATPSLADQLRPVISSSTSIVLLQNGVGAEAPLHDAFPQATIISAVVWTGGRVAPPTDDGKPGAENFNREGLTIGVDYREAGDKADEDAKLKAIVGMLEKGGSECKVVNDIQSERWIKVIWNCCWNSLTTVTRQRTSTFFLSSDEALPLCYTVMREVEAVAKAKGLSIPDGTVDRLIGECTSVKAGLPSSMLFDCLAGRAMETEVILGTPLKEGKRLGVPVPSLTVLYTIVKALDYANLHPKEIVL